MTQNDTRPSLRPTSASSLVVAALVAAAVGWLLIAHTYASFPSITWAPAVLFAGLGVVELVLAQSTKARLDRRPGTTPIDPLTAVRNAVLAKASSLAAAIFAGFFAAIVLWLFGRPGGAGSHPAADLPPSIGALGGSIILLVGALLLEHACRVPPQPDEDEDETE